MPSEGFEPPTHRLKAGYDQPFHYEGEKWMVIFVIHLLNIGLTQFDTKKANVRARAVREPPLQRVDSSRFPFSTA